MFIFIRKLLTFKIESKYEQFQFKSKSTNSDTVGSYVK